MKGTTCLAQRLSQKREIDEMVRITGEADHAVVTALNDVQWQPGHDEPAMARHRANNGMLRRGLTRFGARPDLNRSLSPISACR